MAIKPIRSVTKNITPAGSNLVLLDDGVSMGKATLTDAVTVVASPLADAKITALDLDTASKKPVEFFATAAQGTKADTAVQPARTVAAGTGLTGGGDLSADRTIGLDAASQASLALADTATQPGDLATVATSGSYNDLLSKPTLGDLAAKDKALVSDIDAIGTADDTTYLRGDGSWSTPAGGGAAGLKGIGCTVVDTAGLNPATDYEAGDTVGGVVLVAGYLVLRATAGGSATDGVYVVPSSGAASRHPDFNTWAKIYGGVFPVSDGSMWQNTDGSSGTIDTTPLHFSDISTDGDFPADAFRVSDPTDATKKLAFAVSGVAAGNTRQVTVQNKSGTMALLEGTSTNDDAAAGQVGEFKESEVLVASAVSLTTTTAANITSLSLTPGDWDVWGNVAFTAGGSTTVSIVGGWISTTSATLPTTPAKGSQFFLTVTFPTGPTIVMPVGMRRIKIATTTTVYLSCYQSFGASTLGGYGYLAARRAR